MTEHNNQKRQFTGLLQKAGILMRVPVILLAVAITFGFGWMVAFTGTRNVFAGMMMMLIGVVILVVGVYSVVKSFVVTSRVSLRPSNLNPFNVANDVVRVVNGEVARPAEGERIVAWAGPISLRGVVPSVENPTAKETNSHFSVNTMILTNRQIILILLGYDDLPDGANNPYTVFSEHAPGSEATKASQFLSLHKNDWPSMVGKLGGDISQIVSSHYNYGIPYASITRASSRRHELLNHCVDFEMNDGAISSFIFMDKSQRKPILDALRLYVRQVEADEN